MARRRRTRRTRLVSRHLSMPASPRFRISSLVRGVSTFRRLIPARSQFTPTRTPLRSTPMHRPAEPRPQISQRNPFLLSPPRNCAASYSKLLSWRASRSSGSPRKRTTRELRNDRIRHHRNCRR